MGEAGKQANVAITDAPVAHQCGQCVDPAGIEMERSDDETVGPLSTFGAPTATDSSAPLPQTPHDDDV